MAKNTQEKKLLHFNENDAWRVEHRSKRIGESINEFIAHYKTLPDIGAFTQEIYDEIVSHSTYRKELEMLEKRKEGLAILGLDPNTHGNNITAFFNGLRSKFADIQSQSFEDRLSPHCEIPLRDFVIKDEVASFPEDALNRIIETYCKIYLQDEDKELYSKVEQARDILNEVAALVKQNGVEWFNLVDLFYEEEDNSFTIRADFFQR